MKQSELATVFRGISIFYTSGEPATPGGSCGVLREKDKSKPWCWSWNQRDRLHEIICL